MKFKKAGVIVSAIASTAVCASLIAGSTFALFTSSDKVDITVSSGKVSISAAVDEASLKTYSFGVEQAAGTFENGGTAGFNDEAKFVVSNITPGDSATFNIVVTNDSTVKVKYKVGYTISGELAAALQTEVTGAAINAWTLWETPVKEADKTKTIAVSVALPESVGNEYQEKSASMEFCIEAVQGNANTGIDNQGEAINELLNGAVNANGLDIKCDIAQEDKIVWIQTNADVNFNGHTVEAGQVAVWHANGVVSDVVINQTAGGISGGETYPKAFYMWDFGELTLRNVTIQANYFDPNNLSAIYLDGDGSDKALMLNIEDGCKIVGEIWAQNANSVVNIKGGEFDFTTSLDVVFHTFFGATVNITGGKFKLKENYAQQKADVEKYLADGYTLVEEDGYFVVKAN